MTIFTARRHGSAVCTVVVVSVYLTVTSRCSAETAKSRITQTSRTKSQGVEFSDVEELGKTQPESTQTEAPNAVHSKNPLTRRLMDTAASV